MLIFLSHASLTFEESYFGLNIIKGLNKAPTKEKNKTNNFFNDDIENCHFLELHFSVSVFLLPALACSGPKFSDTDIFLYHHLTIPAFSVLELTFSVTGIFGTGMFQYRDFPVPAFCAPAFSRTSFR